MLADSVVQLRCAKIPGARLSERLTFVQWHLIFVGPQYGTCFIALLCPLKFGDGCHNFGIFVHP